LPSFAFLVAMRVIVVVGVAPMPTPVIRPTADDAAGVDLHDRLLPMVVMRCAG